MVEWLVFLNGSWIDSVFYNDGIDAEEVKDGLVNHDGYNSHIRVYKAKVV